MIIELDSVQSAVLREVVRTRLSNLSSEIRHTDTPRYRRELRAEREALRAVLDGLPVPVVAAAV